MDSVGVVVSSHGREVEVQVKGDDVELGSILQVGENFGIVASMHYAEDEKIGAKQKLIAQVQIFGRLVEGRLKRIKKPLKPYTEVFFAGDKELEGILSVGDAISIGTVYGTSARAFINASEFDRHTAILASTGSGKSYTTANLIKEFSTLGLPVVVVDTHGEYVKLLGKLSEKHDMKVEVYTVKRQRQGLNQLKIPISNLEACDFHYFIPLTEPQESGLADIIGGLGSDYVIEDVVNGASRLDPKVFHEGTIQALTRKLKTLSRVFKDVFDKYGTDISNLVSPNQVTIIDCSLASQGVRRSVVSYLSKEILSSRVNKLNDFEGKTIEYPLLFVVEEAHNYAGSTLSHSCKTQLQRIASEGRKFGIGLCVISQKPSKIDEEILSQCNTGIYMHITNPRDKDHIRKSFESINDAIISDLDSLDVGECIIAGAMLDIPFLMCTVDWIEVKKEKKSKFDFKRKKEVKVGGLDYA
ncbi:MAG: ATP-binding protein [Candidatus Altiarchaeota archaeon]